MRIIPPRERFGRVQSNAELRVADLLAQVDLGEPATCLYSIHIPRHEYKRMSEIDFLILMDGLVLVIEVKGGRLARHNGVWTFTNRYGEVNEKREGPFEQARSAMFALEGLLSERVPGIRAQFGSLVVTADQHLEPDIEWAPQEHAGPEAMSVAGLTAAMTSAARFWRRGRSRAEQTRMTELLKTIRQDFDRVPRLSLLAGGFEHEFVRLATEQYAALEGSEVNPRLFVTGGAGSGKTLLAIETARRASANGDHVVLTCKSPGVIDVMRRHLVDSDVVCLPYDETSLAPPADLLVIDEAQDIMTLDDLIRIDTLIAGGVKDGRWRVFCDPNNQAHVDGHFDPSVAAELASLASRYHLPYNCRNTAGIVQQTQIVTGADLGIAKAGEGPAVRFLKCDDDAEASAHLDAEIDRLRRDEIAPSDIVVLSLRPKVDLSSAIQTRNFRRRRLKEDANDQLEDVVRLSTAREFKGLEAAHVIVVDIDDLSTSELAASLYVAMTRPRISLSLIVNDRAWAQIRLQTVGKGVADAIQS